jgi:hypothetical protein
VQGAGRPVRPEEPLVQNELAVRHEHECVLFDFELETRSVRTPGAVGGGGGHLFGGEDVRPERAEEILIGGRENRIV